MINSTTAPAVTAAEIRTGIWYNDRSVVVEFPPNWRVHVIAPATPAPLTDEEIGRCLDEPVGQPPLTELARGRRHVVIIVDDLSRPTPAHRIMPHLLRRLSAAGIADDAISVVIATGTHGHQDKTAISNKLGPECMQRCRVRLHDDLRDTRYMGKTSYGTRIYVNREVAAADLLIGIGGIYPQHTTGFGGGGKLALGVCGRRTIMELHTKHGSMGGTYNTNNDFRRDVTEIARLIRLNTIATLHIDSFSNVVRAVSGDYLKYYDEAAEFSRRAYDAPAADDSCDVVIANAYPLDTSFTFMRKGYKALYSAPRSCVKIMIASASEGVGVHGLFQFIDPSPWSRLRNTLVRLRNVRKRSIPLKLWRRIAERFARNQPSVTAEEKVTALPPNSRHLYVWRTDPDVDIQPIDDLTVMHDWNDLIRRIDEQHFVGRELVRARLYACAPLQCIETGPSTYGSPT